MREVWASGRLTPEEALHKSLAASQDAWCCEYQGVPALMWGVSRKGCILSDVGLPWLLGTDAIRAVQREFLRQSRSWVRRMHRDFERLENHVHAANKLSIRWLRWCGFVVEDKTPLLLNGEAFYKFWRVRHV